MRRIEFEVLNFPPPRNIGTKSMWSNPTEVPRVVALRKSAYKVFKDKDPFTESVKLRIEIRIPKNYNMPGDLDNFIKGICDSLSRPTKALQHPDFEPHGQFELPENEHIHPERKFRVIEDDGKIVEIHAKEKDVGENWWYRVIVTGND
ncbi:MAG: hypothetical protein KAW09_05145 [Thermoplasmata archaeon]|nr:hypothetical protein [Thermoplasmata archaeon]